MLVKYVEQAAGRIPALQENGLKVSRTIHKAILGGGEPTRKLADFLHGTWLGHPLHPVLTDLTIGAWALGVFFDAVAAGGGGRRARRVADALIAAGNVSAVPTAITGAVEYSGIQKPAVSYATLHALTNDVNFVLFLLSQRERRRGNRGRGVLLSAAGLGLTAVGAWLGGHLVYRLRVGVDHSEAREGPEDWTDVLAAGELAERKPRRVDVEGSPILLYRLDGRVHAIGAVCSHAGGPLEEGRFDGCYVTCPWHDSVFDLRDGRIKHGPTTHPQPNYAVREQDGRIEIRKVR